jgi:hypothetical protein
LDGQLCFFGRPAHPFLYRRKSRNVGGYLLAGAFAGVVAALVLIVLNAAFGGLQSEQAFAAGVGTSIIFGPLISVIASWLFWRRPELDAPQPDLVAAKFE